MNRRDLSRRRPPRRRYCCPREHADAYAGAATLETKIVRLNLQHTWTTTMSSSQYRDTLHVAYYA